MKKIITILLSIILIVSVGFNIYLYQQNKSTTASIEAVITDIETLSTTASAKDTTLSDSNNQIAELETTIADLQSQIATLTETVSALETENQELLTTKATLVNNDPLDAEIDSLLNASPSPDTDAAIQDTAQQIIAGYLKEHAQEHQEEVDVPGLTPGDPSQDATTPDYSAVDVPEHLMGSFH